MNEEKILDAIRRILANGNNVEIRKSSEGAVMVFEVKKNKVVS